MRRTRSAVRRVVRPAALIALLTAAASAADVWHVDDDAARLGDGGSWAQAFDSLDTALAVADAGDTIRLAQGRYVPSVGAVGTERSFVIPEGVTLLGGYAGVGAADPDARDPAQFPSVLDGDQLGDDVAFDFGAQRTDNSARVLTLLAGVAETRLDGFTVRGGRNTELGPGGGGLHAEGASFSAFAVRFEDNEARVSGGGVSLSAGCSAVFDSCAFVGNAVGGLPNTTTSAAGGALDVQASAFVLRDCSFTDNRARFVADPAASSGGAANFGAGLGDTHSGRVERCVFTGNQAHDVGGAVDALGDVAFVACSFADNSTGPGVSPFFGAFGGAASIAAGVTMERCRFTGNRAAGAGGGAGSAVLVVTEDCALIHCSFVGNGLPDKTGAAVETLQAQQLVIAGCTFAHNVASAGTAGLRVALTGGSGLVSNSLFWGNSSGSAGSSELAQIGDPEGQLDYAHNSVQGWTGALGGAGNAARDPLFVDLDGPDDQLGTLDDDPRLGPLSACIDAGDSALVPVDALDADCDGDLAEPAPIDLAGFVRRVDDAAVPDTGLGAPVVDVGALEFGAGPPADAWTDLGGGSPGAFGTPQLVIAGTFCEGQPLHLSLTDIPPGVPILMLKSFQSTPFPKWGGTLHAFPIFAQFLRVSKPNGSFVVNTVVPDAVPSGLTLYYQFLVNDPSLSPPILLSNAMVVDTP